MGKLTHTVSGAVASFKSADAVTVENLVIGIEPVQDLHGYDHPWPGGSGKNLIPDTTDTNNGYVNGYYLNADGTTTENESFYISEYFPITDGEDYLFVQDGVKNAPSVCFYDSGKNYLSGISYNKQQTIQLTVPQNTAFARASQGMNVIVMIETGTVAHDIEPYSNICPITGWTGCDIAKAGENFFDKEQVESGYYIDSSGTKKSASSGYASNYQRIAPNKTFRMSQWYGSNVSRYIAFYTEENISSFISAVKVTYTGGTFTTPDNANYFRCSIGNSYLDNLMITLGDDEQGTYESYSGQNYSVTFPNEAGTVYGGTLTIDKDGGGTLTVTHEHLILDETKSYTSRQRGTGNSKYWGTKVGDLGYVVDDKLICDKLKQETISVENTTIGITVVNTSTFNGAFINIRPANNITDAAFAEWIAENNLEVVFELAEPITYTLTAQQVTALLGQNNIWADTGDVSVEYPFYDHLVTNHNRMLNPHIETTSGAIASFNTGLTLPVKELQIAIEPVQTGEGDPYPPGASKNMFDPVGSLYQSGYGLDDDGNIVSSSNYNVYKNVLPEGTYAYSSTESNSSANKTLRVITYDSNDTKIELQKLEYTSTGRKTLTFTVTSATAYVMYSIRSTMSDIQVESGSTATDYTPYSNIRPISGFTSCAYAHSGEIIDLADYTGDGYVSGKYYLSSDGSMASSTSSTYRISAYIPLPPNTYCRFDHPTLNNPSYCFYDANKTYISGTKYGNNLVQYFTTPSNCAYIRATWMSTSTRKNIYITYSTNTIAFPNEAGTVYGGTLTIDKDGNGELVVDREVKTITSCSNGNVQYARTVLGNYGYVSGLGKYQLSNMLVFKGDTSAMEGKFNIYNSSGYNKAQVIFCFKDCRGSSATRTKDLNQAKLTELNNAGTPLQVCYGLANPITYTLTASQIRTLFGQNNIWADTGDIIKCDYWKQ